MSQASLQGQMLLIVADANELPALFGTVYEGNRVWLASTLAEAEDIYTRYGSEINLIISDSQLSDPKCTQPTVDIPRICPRVPILWLTERLTEKPEAVQTEGKTHKARKPVDKKQLQFKAQNALFDHMVKTHQPQMHRFG